MADLISNTFTSPSSGKQWFYLSAGPSDGPLVCFLHGWPVIARTWLHQMRALSSLGFYVVAPDMPGYGQTWSSKESSDFALENLVPQLLDLLQHLGRKEAIWFGHDWGCGPLWALASHHPEVCKAVIGMSVPYRTVEMGVKHLITLVDRDLYPEKEFPYGQWDYQVFYEQDSDSVDRQFETRADKYFKLFFLRGNAEAGLDRARTTNIIKDKGWFGGPDAPVPDIPVEKIMVDQALLDEVLAGVKRHGFRGASSWYLNHAANAEYTKKSVNNGILKMPVLFIHTEYDAVCQTVHNPRFMIEMRKNCENLNEFVIKAGHFGMLECPEETNAGVVEWLMKEVKDWWPAPELKSRI